MQDEKLRLLISVFLQKKKLKRYYKRVCGVKERNPKFASICEMRQCCRSRRFPKPFYPGTVFHVSLTQARFPFRIPGRFCPRLTSLVGSTPVLFPGLVLP